MRYVIYGTGAIGGVVAGQLHRAGHDVVAIARGAQLEAISRHGLRLKTPEESVTVDLRVVASPSAIRWRGDEVVLLAVKSQDTHGALRQLQSEAPHGLPIVCLQNGVANERAALRHYIHVYGAVVMVPATFLEPGVVLAHSAPVTGILDLGRYPVGTDTVSEQLTKAFRSATFDARALPDTARWKYAKLLANLSNAVEAVCGTQARRGPITDLAREEGRVCLHAAGIDYASPEQDRARRADLLPVQPVSGQDRQGSSTWQSLARATGGVETDYLNGEIVLLGRLHNVPTPVNALLQYLANQHARARRVPGTVTPRELLALLERQAEPKPPPGLETGGIMDA